MIVWRVEWRGFGPQDFPTFEAADAYVANVIDVQEAIGGCFWSRWFAFNDKGERVPRPSTAEENRFGIKWTVLNSIDWQGHKFDGFLMPFDEELERCL